MTSRQERYLASYLRGPMVLIANWEWPDEVNWKPVVQVEHCQVLDKDIQATSFDYARDIWTSLGSRNKTKSSIMLCNSVVVLWLILILWFFVSEMSRDFRAMMFVSLHWTYTIPILILQVPFSLGVSQNKRNSVFQSSELKFTIYNTSFTYNK